MKLLSFLLEIAPHRYHREIDWECFSKPGDLPKSVFVETKVVVVVFCCRSCLKLDDGSASEMWQPHIISNTDLAFSRSVIMHTSSASWQTVTKTQLGSSPSTDRLSLLLVLHCYIFTNAFQGPYSLSGKTSYCKILWSLEVKRFGFSLFQSPRNLTGTSAAALPRCLSNFRAICSL